MSFDRRCECDECNRQRRIKKIKRLEEEKLGNLGRRRLNVFREGDKIRVFSGGDRIDGRGVFIRVENGFLIWVDHHANINMTSLDFISVKRIF